MKSKTHKNAFITEYNSISPFGFSNTDLRNGLLGEKVLISQLSESFFKNLLPVRFAGLIPNQIIEASFINDTDIYLAQKKKWIEQLFANFDDRISSNISNIIFVHNIGSSIYSYFENKYDNRSNYWQSKTSPFLREADFLDYLKIDHNKSITLHNTCASVTAAVAYAKKRISLGLDRSTLIIAFENSNHQIPTWTSLYNLGVLNVKNTEIEMATIPFSSQRSGFVKADALGYLLIESEDSLEEQKKNAIATICGQSITSDSYSLTDGLPDGSMVSRTMQNSINDGHLNINDIDYINAHGSGTFLNDEIEAKAIFNLFNSNKNNVKVSSTKSYFGHALCATGIVEIISVLEMFKKSFIIPNLNYDEKDSTSAKINIVKNLDHQKINYCLKNSFGFGGYNASIILKNVAHG